MDFKGNDINDIETEENYGLGGGRRKSHTECQKLCQSTKGCNVFSYNSKYNACWLKSTESGKGYSKEAISGPKICPKGIKYPILTPVLPLKYYILLHLYL